MNPIIEVRHISKRYNIKNQQPYLTLRDSLSNMFRNPKRLFTKEEDYFWALSNLSFDVNKGEILGIIGKNGAGKSTLLKIISRITPPTKGIIKLRGRMASLLEVGTGFHPELTGRENIYLNGAILGMTRRDISNKFDEIVSFSEIDNFLDMPVKHYSSGMYTRLAFSVAAHLDPEILMVDEVLSVGDAAFQKKSLGKMRDVSNIGRTILFVSHNLSAIANLCNKVVYLKNGKIIKIGPPNSVIETYLEDIKNETNNMKHINARIHNNEIASLISVKVKNEHDKNTVTFDITKPITIEIKFEIKKTGYWVGNNIQISNAQSVLLFNSPEDINQTPANIPKMTGVYVSKCLIPGNLLAEGIFSVRVTFITYKDGKLIEIDVPDAISFEVIDISSRKSVKGKSTGTFPGIMRPKLKWERQIVN